MVPQNTHAKVHEENIMGIRRTYTAAEEVVEAEDAHDTHTYTRLILCVWGRGRQLKPILFCWWGNIFTSDTSWSLFLESYVLIVC